MGEQPLFPTRVRKDGLGLIAEMKVIAASEFQDAFVEETVRRVAGWSTTRPLRGDRLRDIRPEALCPAGIIYHVSKCGSTLASQMLKKLNNTVVYSQPMALNDILMPPHLSSRSEIIGSLRSLGELLSFHSSGRYILKTESWNVLYCDLLQAAFPTTPWVFCIRDPVDIAISVMEDPDPVAWYKLRRSFDNPFRPHLRRSIPQDDDDGKYISHFYAEFCDSISMIHDHMGRIISYEQFPDAVCEVIAPHFGLELTPADLTSITECARYYSKAPLGEKAPFVPDTDGKRLRANESLQRAANRLARPHYERLRSSLRSESYNV